MVMPCGFESHLSHQKRNTTLTGGVSFLREMGLEEADLAFGKVAKCPANTWLGRGRVPQLPDASRSGWGWKLHFPNIGKATLSGGLETVDKLSGAGAPKAPLVRGAVSVAD